MLDLEKDVKIEVFLRNSGKARANINLIIDDFIKINSFQIIEAANGKLYVINPHSIEQIYNKVEFKKEITYNSTATLLPHKYRKKLVDMMIEAYGEELDRQRKLAKGKEVRGATNTGKYCKEEERR